jgi:hypothetical protein
MVGGAPDLDNVALKNADRRPGNPQQALGLERFFTTPGRDPMNEVDWELRTAVITGEDRDQCRRIQILSRLDRRRGSQAASLLDAARTLGAPAHQPRG